ncbi:hypothetical protein CLOM_g14328 [Closterium sp. NIES-68]|nr:hypothetical protein CLOM_g14328 [Closterium sp. NIES-68]GJP61688.1 hypothetical protein CLOP_g18834 [Closterium sp. NIES-67]
MGPPARSSGTAVSAASADSRESTRSYVQMVQHLIERCLLLNLSRDECVVALAKHAGVKPAITATVWKALEKENKSYFDEYSKQRMLRRAQSQRLRAQYAKDCAERVSQCMDVWRLPVSEQKPTTDALYCVAGL